MATVAIQTAQLMETSVGPRQYMLNVSDGVLQKNLCRQENLLCNEQQSMMHNIHLRYSGMVEFVSLEASIAASVAEERVCTADLLMHYRLCPGTCTMITH